MQSTFHRILEDGDVGALRRAWAEFFPLLPQPNSDAKTQVILHRARTEAESVSLPRRCYSHAWLTERGLPSGLPHELRPPGERDRPIIVSAVGISVNARKSTNKELAKALEKVMSDAAAECYAEGKTEPSFVSARMWEARDRFVKGV